MDLECFAVYDFTGDHDEYELSFKEGDPLVLLDSVAGVPEGYVCCLVSR